MFLASELVSLFIGFFLKLQLDFLVTHQFLVVKDLVHFLVDHQHFFFHGQDLLDQPLDLLF